MIKRKELIKRINVDFPLQIACLEETIDRFLTDRIETGKYDILTDYQVRNITKSTIGIPFYKVSFLIPTGLHYVKNPNEQAGFEETSVFDIEEKHFQVVVPKYEEEGYIISYHKYCTNYNFDIIFSKEKY